MHLSLLLHHTFVILRIIFNSAEEAAGRLPPEHEDSGPLTSEESAPLARTNQDPSLYYDMTGDKFLIIFNHYEYKNWRMG